MTAATTHPSDQPTDRATRQGSDGDQTSGDPRLTAWADRARAGGHPVLATGCGRLRPVPIGVPVSGMPINDVLDLARQRAQARVAWVYAMVATPGALLALAEAVMVPAPVAPRGRPGLFARRPARARRGDRGTGGAVWSVGPVAASITVDGVTAHVLELPVAWLDLPVTALRRPAGSTRRRAQPLGVVAAS